MKLFLHICCAPCAAAIVDKIKNDNIMELEGFYYNPNIHPVEEYDKRKLSVQELSKLYNMPLTIVDENGLDYWKKKLTHDKATRCTTCYTKRFNETARIAKEKGFVAFTTSLLISPYQNHELIIQICKNAALKYGLEFYYEDFRNLYRKGREMSRAKGFYMQKYCGCIYSYSESHHPKKPIYNMLP
jgi:predicted adenine nucleotide alpha hydrolase (AANH) superfamily ATPase